MITTSLTLHTNELQEISGLPTDPALQRAAPFLARLVEDPAFVESEIFPSYKRRRGRRTGTWPVATTARTAPTP